MSELGQPSANSIEYTVLGPWDLWNKYKGDTSGYQFADTKARFVWTHTGAERRSNMPVKTHTFTSTFSVPEDVSATIHTVVDNISKVYLNGNKVGEMNGGWRSGTSYPKIPVTLEAGVNTIEFKATNPDPPSPGGLLVSVITDDGTVVSRTGDSTWSLENDNRGIYFVTQPAEGTEQIPVTTYPPAMDPIIVKDTLFGIDKKIAIALIVVLILAIIGSIIASIVMSTRS